MIIANTTVISNFASVGRLEVLHTLLGQLYLSTEVLAEIQDGYAEGNLFYQDIDKHIFPFAPGGWLLLTALLNDEELRLFHLLPSALHRGEASSIAIAHARGWVFLSDDAKARKTANELGVPVSGTLGLLVKAVRAAILASEEADALLVQMIAGGYRSPRPTISELL